MKRRILPFILAGALTAAMAAPAAAGGHQDVGQRVNQDAVQRALVGVIVQAAVRDVEVVTLRDSLNNLLRDADIDVDILNITLDRVLQNVDVNIEDIQILSPEGDLILTVNLLTGDVTIAP